MVLNCQTAELELSGLDFWNERGGTDEKELIIDNFAGGGGASTGIELAIGRSVDIAITMTKQRF